MLERDVPERAVAVLAWLPSGIAVVESFGVQFLNSDLSAVMVLLYNSNSRL